MTDLAFSSILEQAELIRRGDISPVELVRAYMERIEKFDRELNAFVTLAFDQALESAQDAERRAQQGEDLPPFHGVPIAIKDLNETAGIRTTFSCKAFKDYVPDLDAAVVRRIKEAGFIIVGKTNTPEFGTIPFTESELNGDCRNPWDTARTPGGSSGGAAASLAAGLVPAAQGSDGGGSIRIPASCCGVFGIKPSRGRISTAPRLGHAWEGFSTDGPIARYVRDAAALLDVMEGYETGDPYWLPSPERPFLEQVEDDPGRLRIGLTTTTPTGVPVDPQCAAAAEDAARLLESLGHSVEEATPAWVDDALTDDFIKVVMTQPAFVLFEEPSQLEPVNAALFEAARELTTLDHLKAVTSLHAASRRIVAFWDDHDLLLTPTLALPPVQVGWVFEETDGNPWAALARSGLFIPFTPAFNITGQPAASVPLYWTEEGLPVGVQIAGGPAADATVLQVARQLEEARPWPARRPPVS